MTNSNIAPRPDLVTGDDGRARCAWGASDPLYIHYHDDEWGRPLHDERALFELLCLEAFQSGLAWITILRKRPGFRTAFDNFDAEVVATYGDGDVARLMADAAIVRNRAKVDAAIANARATVALHEAGRTLVDLVFGHTPPPGERPAARTPPPTRPRRGGTGPRRASRWRPPVPAGCRRTPPGGRTTSGAPARGPPPTGGGGAWTGWRPRAAGRPAPRCRSARRRPHSGRPVPGPRPATGRSGRRWHRGPARPGWPGPAAACS